MNLEGPVMAIMLDSRTLFALILGRTRLRNSMNVATSGQQLTNRSFCPAGVASASHVVLNTWLYTIVSMRGEQCAFASGSACVKKNLVVRPIGACLGSHSPFPA